MFVLDHFKTRSISGIFIESTLDTRTPPAYENTYWVQGYEFEMEQSQRAPLARGLRMKLLEVCLKGGPMPAAGPSKELRALCHEHHVEMRLIQSLVNSEDNGKQTLAYACTKPDCPVRYNLFRGYFMLPRDGNTNQMDMVPEVRCPQDGAPMYLTEIDGEKRDFRLWQCPRCDGRLTNEEGLAGGASQKIKDVNGKSVAGPQTPGIDHI